jgi:hypothetical protein
MGHFQGTKSAGNPSRIGGTPSPSRQWRCEEMLAHKGSTLSWVPGSWATLAHWATGDISL